MYFDELQYLGTCICIIRQKKNKNNVEYFLINLIILTKMYIRTVTASAL